MACFRQARLLQPDARVRYAVDVSGAINREAWAGVVGQLIHDETAGNTTRFAALVGVTYKTVRRWLKQETEVSEESVRQVARAVYASPLELLVRVGAYSAEDLAAPTEARQADAGDDPALQVILNAADVAPHMKQRFIRRLHELRAKDAERQVDEVNWWIEQSRGA